MNPTIRTALLCTLFGLSTAAFAKDAAKAEKPEAPKGEEQADKSAKPINKTCPVEGGEVDPEVTVVHKGKTIGFCCAGCDTEFKKEPAKYMAKVDAELKEQAKGEAEKDGEKHESHDGDAKHAEGDHADDAHAEGEDKQAEGEGDAKAAKLNAKCPVSGDDADPKLTSDYKGRTVAFCCEECAKDFEKTPKKYLASLEAQDKAAKAEDDHDHDGDGKADHDEKDHKDDEHDHEHEHDKAKGEKAKQ